MSRLKISDGLFQKDLDALAQFGRTRDGAIHRVAYSQEDGAAREWLHRRLRQIGLDPQLDAAGNTTALYSGHEEKLAPIGIGSHTDTVPYGGAFDGALGVIAALAVIETLHSAGHRLRHPVELINFAAEEATMAGGTTGSQAMTGIFDMSVLDKKAWDGQLVRAHLEAAGLDPLQIGTAARPKGSLAAFLELHIEQSTRLEQAQTDIAIVDGFVGIRRYAVRFDGTANHAGTTSMAVRDDALVKAAPLIQYVRDVAVELGIVGTIGDFNVYPGAPNVIPEKVELVVEIRGLDATVLDQAETIIAQRTRELTGHFDPIVRKPPVKTDRRIQSAIANACDQSQLSYLTMPSGAGHDAMVIDHICPQGMLFVPSKAGVSHSRLEYTTPEQCLHGAQILLDALLLIDSEL